MSVGGKVHLGLHSLEELLGNGGARADIPGMQRDDWYHKEDRIKYLRGKFRHLQDPLADLAGGNLPPNAKIFVNGEETTRARLQEQFRKVLDSGYDFLETDYHHD